MSRSIPALIFVVVCGLLVSPPAWTQPKHRAPAAKGEKRGHGEKKGHRWKKKHREAPAPEPSMPVRKAPVVSDFQPAEGAPGAVVVIRGDHFDPTTKVRFNGRWLKIVSRNDPGEISVKIHGNAVTDHFVISKAGFSDLSAPRPFNVIRPPLILSFMPRTGGPGTVLKIAGAHFLPSDSFVIGGFELQVKKIKPDRARVVVPEGATPGKIGVRRGDRVMAWSKGPFDVIGAAPVVTDFNPGQGSRGVVVRINGRNFAPDDWAELNGRRLPIKGRSHNFLEVQIGNHTTGPFMVRGRHGRRALSTGTFSVLRPPVVQRFFPPFGPPGTRVTILGAAFAAGDQVWVGNAMLTIRTLAEGKIVAELPTGVTSGPVVVQRGGRKFPARGSFEVIYPPVITDLDPKVAPPGAKVMITGRNFLPDTSVLLAGRQMRIIKKRLPTEIVVEVPADARSGQLVVVTRGGSFKTPFAFNVAQFAQISSFFPLHAVPGALISIRGTSFHPGVRVFFRNVQLKIHAQSPKVLKVEVPLQPQLKGKSARLRLESHGRSVESQLELKIDEPRPEVEFTFHPETGRRGSEVTLFLTPPRPAVTVYFDGRPLPKKVLEGGKRLVVTVPGDARSGLFELEFGDKRYSAKKPFRVR